MFDIGGMELLIIGIVALIVVGPRDLPGMFRNVGRFIGKARSMAREFQRAMEQAADDSGVKDMAKEFRDAASPRDFGTDEMSSFARDPKAWAKKAASESVLDPEAEADGEGGAPPAAGTARPRGPATEAVARARSEAAGKRRAELAARRAGAEGGAEDGPRDGGPAEKS